MRALLYRNLEPTFIGRRSPMPMRGAQAETFQSLIEEIRKKAAGSHQDNFVETAIQPVPKRFIAIAIKGRKWRVARGTAAWQFGERVGCYEA